MNSKLLVGTMRLAIIAGSLIVIAGGNTTNAQVEENLSFNFHTWVIDYSKGNRVEILINTPDSQKFLSDPINTLKRKGVAVPRAAEAPWRAFTGALQRLATSHRTKAKGSRRSSMNKEILTFSFDKITVLGTIAGDWNGDGTITAGARKASAGFLDDPLATLRAGRVEVPAADERGWRQLAEALKELQGVYSRIRIKRNAEGQQAPSELNGRTGVEGRQAVAPRGWDPKKKTAVAGPSETSQEQASAVEPDRPFILGRIPNNKGNVLGGPGFDSVRSLGSLGFNFTKVELAREETLRVDLTNRMVLKRQEDDPPRVYALVKLYDSTGQVIAQSQKVSLPRNQVRPVTFNRSAIPLPGAPRTGRLQIRVAVEVEVQTTDRNTIYVNTAGGGVWASLKVIHNVTGKLTAGPSGQVSNPFSLYIGTGETNNGGGSGPDRMKVKGAYDLRITEYVFSLPKDDNDVKVFMVTDGHTRQTSRSAASFALFAARFKNAGGNYDPLTKSDKVVLVHIVNAGYQATTPCRLTLMISEINGVAVGRQKVATVEALARGKDAWILIDAGSILPNSVALEATTFKLNVDSTNLLQESSETNNEVRHNL